ncbi:MAG: hypothetical protein K6G62_06870 [Eubacterium sp.]|nr:hypothetical protein [Eubacterium sp.]
MEANKKEHFGLALASIILGGVGLLGFMFYGLSAIPGLIGAIFGLICLIKGKKSVRLMGGIGMTISVFAVITAVAMVFVYIGMINWDNMTYANIMAYENIDPSDNEAVMDWVQQFLNVDISAYY